MISLMMSDSDNLAIHAATLEPSELTKLKIAKHSAASRNPKRSAQGTYGCKTKKTKNNPAVC
jgi:hypothetical protein